MRSMPSRGVTTGTLSASTSSRNASVAFAILTPWPATKTGRSALAMASANQATASTGGGAAGSIPSACGSNPGSASGSTCAPCTSSGTSIQTGPGRPDSARCIAFSRWYLAILGSSSMTLYLVEARTIGRMSASCTPNCLSARPQSWMVCSLFACPEITKSGVESCQAPTSPVSALVAPGPVVTSATPKPPRCLA